MDWKYILSVDPNEINEDAKDELFNTITWFDIEEKGELDLKKCKALLRVSQEVLKYKGEQVETLLHELEENAIRQGEEEAKRLESESDVRSVKSSRKSTSIEYENLEQKYIELKAKYKKALKVNEKQSSEIDKLNSKVKKLTQENRRLENELKTRPSSDVSSESDISESIKDRQRDLLETIQSKNKQISDLLNDIEDVEKENSVLRDKLTTVRDELALATKEITSMTELLKEKDGTILENTEQLTKATELCEQAKKAKLQLEDELKKVTTQLNTKLDDLQTLLDKKDKEILALKSHLRDQSLNSSISSLPKDDPDLSHLEVVKKILREREDQLSEVQSQLRIATKEIQKCTEEMKSMKVEKDRYISKINELEDSVKEMKSQLQVVHERCQKLQDEVVFTEKVAEEKEKEIQEILDKIENSDIAEIMREIHDLKSSNRLKEKQIINLVKTSNKLQDACENLEKQNYVLRHQLGIPEDEHIDISIATQKERKFQKEINHLKQKIAKREDYVLSLKTELHQLNQVNASLTNQILELGHKPIYGKLASVPDKACREEFKAIVDENEALRKGLNEILNSVNAKREGSLKEINSETLEQLLRALDVKHISGWYHPAIRLQAELHNIEGINTELREQLREIRIELKKYKDGDFPVKVESDIKEASNKVTNDSTDSTEASLLKINPENLKDILRMVFLRVNNDNTGLSKLQQEFESSYCKIFDEQIRLTDQLKKTEEDLKQVELKHEIVEEKLKVLTDNTTDVDRVKKIEELITENVTLKRKVIYLENEVKSQSSKLEQLHKSARNIENSYLIKINGLQKQNKILEANLTIAKNIADTSVNIETHNELQKQLQSITVKYRELAEQLKEENEARTSEMQILRETETSLNADKIELRSKLADALSKLHLQNVSHYEDKEEKLAQKLSEAEVNEITERQRANHTNNLYELVKEQLNKSEERFKDYSKYNEELLKKNLILQEQLNDVENVISAYVDKTLYNRVQLTNNELLKEKEKLQVRILELEGDNMQRKKDFECLILWNETKEQELLNLKHQIVDLIAVSEEKVIISQLNSDVLQYKQSQNFYKKQAEEYNEELKKLKEEFEAQNMVIQKDKIELVEKEAALSKKIGHLQNLLKMQKIQYLGCAPLRSEETYINNLKIINKEKHEAFLALYKAKSLENEAVVLKEKLDLELEYLKKEREMLSGAHKKEYQEAMTWMQEKKNLQINELRYKRQSEFKESQIQHFLERIRIQDEQIAKLDEEMSLLQKSFGTNLVSKENLPEIPKEETPLVLADDGVTQEPGEKVEVIKPISPTYPKIISRSVETQTDQEVAPVKDNKQELVNLKGELLRTQETLREKEQIIDQLRSKINENEMTISLFRKQIGDKQSQISFYERHILELQSKKEEIMNSSGGAGGDNISVGAETQNEVLALKGSIKDLQDRLNSKDEEIMKYQTLLKVDRDKHSLAAATLQEELQKLKISYLEEKQKNESLKESFAKQQPNRAALEQYISQVHALEKHTSELHTKISSLEAQLQSSREENVRWMSLANDRLKAMEELRISLEDQHKNELMLYKTDSEKLKELSNDEKNNLLQLIQKQRMEYSGRLEIDIQKIIKEKDDKIHELTVKLRQIKTDSKKSLQPEPDLSPKLSELEFSKDQVVKENELLRKRYEQLINREKSARDEIRDLKAQLMRKPSTIRTDKSERTIKEQLQKKIATLENEAEQLKKNLAEQVSIIETHRVQAADNFDKWKKMKHCQQVAEKLKNKLKERDLELEKLQQTSAGYRLLIERLEREKHNLEQRNRSLKGSNVTLESARDADLLRLENMRLQAELEAIQSRMEMQQHHSGALGAAMMQEKLEAQERKIAILELASKVNFHLCEAHLSRISVPIISCEDGHIHNLIANLMRERERRLLNRTGTSEIRGELERLQISNSNIQKTNLRLEAENLDLKLDLEKTSKEVPHLQQQIEHMQSYINVLQSENSEKLVHKPEAPPTSDERKKVSELERTVFMLKRVVEKLQAENKRLMNGKRPLSDRVVSADKLRRENVRLKEQCGQYAEKVSKLEQDLLHFKTTKSVSFSTKSESEKVLSLSDELNRVKEELKSKAGLLDKVKVLLHRAATKEKMLLEEIATLKRQIQCEGGTIREVSEGSNSDL